MGCEVYICEGEENECLARRETRILVPLCISSISGLEISVSRHYFKILENYTSKIDHFSHF